MICRLPAIHLRRFERRLQIQPQLKRIAFEGDSWLSYPGALGGNLYSRLSRRYARVAASLQMAEPGDEVASVLQGCQQRLLREVLRSRRPDLLIYSGGGNDIIGDALRDLLKAADDAPERMPVRFFHRPLSPVVSRHLRLAALDHALLRIAAGYAMILDLRDKYAPTCRVLAHTYDYALPSGQPFAFLGMQRGPWIRPVCDAAGVARAEQPGLIGFLIDEFAHVLRQLQGERAGFDVIDCRGVLTPEDWNDEIHPSARGFKRLVEQCWAPVLDALLR